MPAEGAAPAGRAELRACRRIINQHARSFSFAAGFLPRGVRNDVAVVYAYYRLLDDLVDDPPEGLSRQALLQRLTAWESWLSGPLEPSAWAGATGAELAVIRALPAVILSRGLDPAELRIVLRGLRADLDHRRPANLGELEAYAFDVAGSVGLVMARLLGARLPEAAAPAAAMGSAMQLTNVCRDVEEDLRRGRIYLPLEVCADAGCDDLALEQRRATPGVRRAVAVVAERARQLYSEGVAGLSLLPAGARLPIAVAARAYATILERLAARDHDVFAGRVAVPGRARWAMALRLAAGRAAGGVGGRG